MKTSKEYLREEDIKQPVVGIISAIKREIIDGRPQLVLYFEGEKKGLLVTRWMADELTKCLGPNPIVDEFFAKEGLQ